MQKDINNEVDLVMHIVCYAMDKMANSHEGNKMIDDMAAIIGRFYKELTQKHGIPSELAGVIVSNNLSDLLKSGKK